MGIVLLITGALIGYALARPPRTPSTPAPAPSCVKVDLVMPGEP